MIGGLLVPVFTMKRDLSQNAVAGPVELIEQDGCRFHRRGLKKLFTRQQRVFRAGPGQLVPGAQVHAARAVELLNKSHYFHAAVAM